MKMEPKHLASMLEGMAKALRDESRRSMFLDSNCKKAHDIGYDFGEGMARDLFTDNAPGLTSTDYIDEATAQVEQFLSKEGGA